MTEKNKKILIVEDDKFLLKAYKIKFNHEEVEIITATDGLSGLEEAKNEKPALIILDLMLPGINGFEFLEKIKADDETKDIPVIAVSVLGQKLDQERAISLGAEEYLIKTNYKLDEIVKKVKIYLK